MTQSSPEDGAPPVPSMLDLMDDTLPSYDTATSAPNYTTDQNGAGSSRAAPPSAPATALSRQAAHLFSGPLNAENLSMPIRHDIEHIHVTDRTFTDGRLSRLIKSESFDERLGEPAVLYDYLRHVAIRIPKIRLRCTGAHTEVSHTDETITINGETRIRRKGHNERVVDFDFYIDMTHMISPSGVHLSVVPPWKPVHRGTHTWSYGPSFAAQMSPSTAHRGYAALAAHSGPTDPGRSLTWAERSAYKGWNTNRWLKGFPTWAKHTDVSVDEEGSATTQQGYIGDEEERGGDGGEEASLVAWCEAFCADQGWMKSFKMRKEVWGWNFEGLIKATRGAIASTGYTSSDLSVGIELDDTEVTVRPCNLWSRAINNVFIYVLLCFTLILPIVWTLNRLALLPPSRVGRKYDVARATYNLKSFPPLPSTYPAESIQSAKDRLPSIIKLNPQLPANPVLRLGPKGVHYLAGRREGEWFAEWEERIRMGAQMRYKGELTGRREVSERVSLDGYERSWQTADQ